MSALYSDEVLEETPERASKLLSGIGAVAAIRTVLDTGGMNDDDIVEGRGLLLTCLVAPRRNAALLGTDAAHEQRTPLRRSSTTGTKPNFARYDTRRGVGDTAPIEKKNSGGRVLPLGWVDGKSIHCFRWDPHVGRTSPPDLHVMGDRQ